MQSWLFILSQYYYDYTHLTTSFPGQSGWVSWYQKGKTSLDLNDAIDDGVFWMHWHQLGHMQTICTLLQTDNHINALSVNFLQVGCSS